MSGPTSSRRSILRGAPAVLLAAVPALIAAPEAVTASVVAYQDAEVVAVCALLVQSEHDLTATMRTAPNTDEGDAMADPFHEEQAELADRLLKMRATTLAGIRAHAQAYVAYIQGDSNANPHRLAASDYTNEKLLGGLLLDLISPMPGEGV